jgi:type IV pilus assembly protein PilB
VKAQVPTTSAPGSRQAVQNGLAGSARILVQGGLLNESDALALVTRAEKEKISFMQAHGGSGRVAAQKAAVHLARTFDLPAIDLDCLDPERRPPEDMFERKRMEESRALPLYIRSNRLYLATDDPNATNDLEYFAMKSGKKVELVVADSVQLTAYLTGVNAGHKKDMLDLSDPALDFDLPGEDEPAVEEVADAESEQGPVVKMVNGILLTAINKGASDIHFEPFEKFYRVRLRVDGVLIEISRQSVKWAPPVASRIKVMSSLNIAEKRVPQDGRMRFNIPGAGRSIDFRVSTCPTVDGEKIVLRILDGSQATMGIEALGYEPEQREELLHAVSRPYGMVLVTGPTGSGKTVSLYTCLNILNSEEKNISTAEDPVEIQLEGINQVNINTAQGLTFPHVLKAFLRQDPDIIMVGEIRDEETAEIAAKAAQTGHLVLSTLHTNDAPKTITRLEEIGLARYAIAATVICITAQRLVRRLCAHCKVDHHPAPDELKRAGMSPEDINGLGSAWKPKTASQNGCERCTRGYKGRVGVYQVMPITDGIREIITKNGTSDDIAAQAAKEGIKDLRRSGLAKYRQGLTSLAEVLGATNL